MQGVRWRQNATSAALCATFLLFPSLGIIQKYFRTRGALVYVAIGLLLFVAAIRHNAGLRSRIDAVDRRWAWRIAAALFVALVVAFAVLYPLSNSGERSWIATAGIAGGGSDRDESLNLGVTELLHGRYPYYAVTQLGNPVSQMPGSLVVAVPFVLLGNAALQNLAWCAVYFFVSVRLIGDVRQGLALAVLLLAACPIIFQDLVTGGDLVANSVMVLSAMVLVMNQEGGSWSTGQSLFTSALLGLALSSRLSFLLLAPLLAERLVWRVGVRQAAGSLLVAALVFLAITLPFYLYDPAGFAPLSIQNKFAQFGDYAPERVVILPALCLAFSIAVALWPEARDAAGWLVRVGLILLMPVVLLVALVSIRSGGLLLRYCAYGIPAALFGALGIAVRMAQPRSSTMAADVGLGATTRR